MRHKNKCISQIKQSYRKKSKRSFYIFMNVFRTFHISKGSVYISCILLLLGSWFGTVKLLLSFPWISGFFCKKINPFHFFCINISSLLSFTLLISAGRIALFYNIWIFFYYLPLTFIE